MVVAGFRVCVLGQVGAARYDLDRSPLHALAALVAAGRGGIDGDELAGYAVGPRCSAENRRLIVSRVRKALGPEAVPRASGGRYRIELDPADVDLWYLEAIAARSLGSPFDLDKVLHCVAWTAPFGGVESSERLAAAIDRAFEARRSALASLVEHCPDLADDRFLQPYESQIDSAPFDEPLSRNLAQLLANCGRPHDAVREIQNLRRRTAESGLVLTSATIEFESKLLAGTADLTPAEFELPAGLKRLLIDDFVDKRGRREELVDHLNAEQPRVILLRGAPGSGLTRMCAEAAAQLGPRWAILYVDGAVGGGRTAFGSLFAVFPGLAEIAQAALRSPERDVFESAVWGFVTSAIRRFTADRPVALFVDDWLLLDSSTRRLVQHLAEASGLGHFKVVIAGAPDAHAARVLAGSAEVAVDLLDVRSVDELLMTFDPSLEPLVRRAKAIALRNATEGLAGLTLTAIGASLHNDQPIGAGQIQSNTGRPLVDHLSVTERGLRSRPGPNTASKKLGISNFTRLLRHPYYRGKIVYKGVVYEGRHEPLIDEKTWNRVQEVLDARGRAGEKQRKHRHYLKGTIFCGECGSRLVESHSRSRSGKIYNYFMCVGRHQKRSDCQLKSIGQDFVEHWIERWYQEFRLSDTLLQTLRSYITDELDAVTNEAQHQHAAHGSRRTRLLNQREKLLQAHYADAIPLSLMKSEQKRITAELDAMERQLAASHHDHEVVVANLEAALEFTAKIGQAYQAASDQTRRQMNQSILKRVAIGENGITGVVFTEIFEMMLQP